MNIADLRFHASRFGCLLVEGPGDQLTLTVPLDSPKGYFCPATNTAEGRERIRAYLAGVSMQENIQTSGLLTAQEETRWRERQAAERKLQEDRVKRGMLA